MKSDILKELEGEAVYCIEETTYRESDVLKAHNKIVDELKEELTETKEVLETAENLRIETLHKLQSKDKEIVFWSDDALKKEREITKLEKKIERLAINKDLKIQRLEKQISDSQKKNKYKET